MASTDVGTRLTEAHRLAQVSVAADTTALSVRAWTVLDPFNLDGTTPNWLRLMSRIVARQALQSATLSARYYSLFRQLEHGDPFAVVALAELDAQQVTTALRVTGPVAVKRNTVLVSIDEAMNVGRSMSSRSASRLALTAGRNTIQQAIVDDPAAVGYQRVTGGKSCSFCRRLAGRGFVYSADSSGFQAHDGCGCTAEPGWR